MHERKAEFLSQPGITFFEPTKQLSMISMGIEKGFQSETLRIGDLGIASMLGINQESLLEDYPSIFSEGTPSIFIHEQDVFIGKAKYMDKNAQPFRVTIHTIPAPSIPTVCRLHYPKFNLVLDSLLEEVGPKTDEPWAIAEDWKKVSIANNDVDLYFSKSYKLYVPANINILSSMYFSFFTKPQSLSI